MGPGDSKSTKRLILMITLTENVEYCRERERKKETVSFSGAGTFIHSQNVLVCQIHVTQGGSRLTALLTDAH